MEQNERIATLETRLDALSNSLERIESKLDAYSSNFMTKSEAEFRFQSIEKELNENKNNKRANSALLVSAIGIVATIVFALINLLK
ncbi:hypothetical protein MHI39_08280 [Heyndrickxia sp. FSL K6-6286]|uniref:hypothetical protein n=1 Tax=Heyndrickxia sp. FSL K6-6286 TaxID=2921510 RepID=UPI00217CC9D1|nr:hypothetical protein [Heyndrickxia oleronia]